jgi:hypothetical protein
MIVYGVLIEHATAGLLLFETGCHDDMEKYWGPVETLPCLPSVNHGMTASGCLLDTLRCMIYLLGSSTLPRIAWTPRSPQRGIPLKM